MAKQNSMPDRANQWVVISYRSGCSNGKRVNLDFPGFLQAEMHAAGILIEREQWKFPAKKNQRFW